MASSGKKKTTMAKLMRESRLRERRLDKKAKKDARKLAPPAGSDASEDALNPAAGESERPETGQPALETVAESRADA